MSFAFCQQRPQRARAWAAHLTSIATFIAWPGLAHSGPALTLDSALHLAVERSRMVAANTAQVEASREMAVAAGELPDPVIKLGVNNLPVDGPDRLSIGRDFMTMRSIGVMQEFTREDKRKARAERFEREAQTGEAQRQLTVTEVRRDTALAWLDRWYQEALHALLVTQMNEASLQVEAAETMYRTGRGMQADIFAAKNLVEQVRDRISQSERQIATTTTMLSRWIGEQARQPLGPGPDFNHLPFQVSELDTQLNHHPQLAVLAGQEAIAVAEANIARAEKQADWSLELMFSQRGSSYSNMVSLNVSIPLQWDQKNRQDRELGAKLAQVEQARAQREDASRMHVAETQAMIEEWEGDRDRLTHYDQKIIPLAQERTQAAMTAYRSGGGPLTAVLEARRGEIDTRTERVKLGMDTARLWAQLTYLLPPGHDASIGTLKEKP